MIAARLSPGAIEQLKPLASQRGFQGGEAGDLPTGTVEPRDDAAGDGVAHVRKDDRDRPRLPLEGNRRRGRVCQDDVGLQADQLLRERSYPIDVTARPNEGPSARCGHRSNPSPQALA